MLDAAMAHLIILKRNGEVNPLSLNINVNFIAPGSPGEFVAKGEITKMGKSIAFTSGELYQGDILIATATATNKIGPFNASFTGDIELKDINAPNSYKITGSGNSPVGFASGEASVKLEEKEGTTELIYFVEANVGGKIAQVGSRLIDMTAKKMADVFFGKFSEIISSTNAGDEKMIFEELNIPTNEKILNQNNNKKKYLYFYFSFAALIVLIIYIFYNNF